MAVVVVSQRRRFRRIGQHLVGGLEEAVGQIAGERQLAVAAEEVVLGHAHRVGHADVHALNLLQIAIKKTGMNIFQFRFFRFIV